MILHRLSKNSSMNHSIFQTSNKALALWLFRHPVWHWNKSVYASLLFKTLSITNPSLVCLVLLLSVVNNFLLITSFSFNCLVVIIVWISFESWVTNLILTKKHCFTILLFDTFYTHFLEPAVAGRWGAWTLDPLLVSRVVDHLATPTD